VVRLPGWLGHRVVKANHLGDWGLRFGMLIEHLRDVRGFEAARELSVGDLTALYHKPPGSSSTIAAGPRPERRGIQIGRR